MMHRTSKQLQAMCDRGFRSHACVFGLSSVSTSDMLNAFADERACWVTEGTHTPQENYNTLSEY